MTIRSSVVDSTGLTHYWVWDFEMAFSNQKFYSKIVKTTSEWWWISIPYAILYIVIVFIGREIMKSRQKFQIRGALILWNLFLTIFSLWGSIRTVPEVFYSYKRHGFTHTLCDLTVQQGITGFWSWLFTISKVPETLDTMFIVLRGQPLSFLHWYHHASVLVYCFYSYADPIANGRWFSSMNYVVHTIMYGYYGLRAARIRVPRVLQQSITMLQLTQMVIGCYINIAAYIEKQNNEKCLTSITNIQFSLLLYFSYFVLFGNYFYQSYFAKKGERKESKKVD